MTQLNVYECLIISSQHENFVKADTIWLAYKKALMLLVG